MSASASTKLFSKCFILSWTCALLLNLCQNMFNNSITLYVTSLGMSTGFAGFLGIPYAILAILMRFLGGDWVDRRSRRSLLAIGCFTFGVTAILFGMIPAAAALILFRGLHGFSYSSGQLAASTINVDVTPPKKINLGIGIFWLSSAISLGCAGYIVTGLTSGGSYMPLFLVGGGCGILAGVLALFCDYEKKGTHIAEAKHETVDAPTYKGILRFIEPAAFRPAILIFMMAMAISCVAMYILMFAQEMSYSNAGLALVFATIGMAIGNLASDRLLNTLGPRNTLMSTFFISAAGLALMALVPNFGTYLLGGATYGYMQGVCMPVFAFLAVDGMPVHRRGVSGGTVYCMLDLGVGIGTYLWGVIIGAAGFTATFLCAAAVLIIGLILSFIFYPTRAKA